MKFRVGVVTGTRAEYGLLRPVMRAIEATDSLELSVIVAGAHFLQPAETWREVASEWTIDWRAMMQIDRESGRIADARALGRGVSSMAQGIETLGLDCVLVLGDRIEAFAAASAGSIGGVIVAHMHGGDVAEGVADEAMRHAITKLAHVHLPATELSADRIVSMGERADSVHVVGSPAIDELCDVEAMEDDEAKALGDPDTLVLFHPIGDDAAIERRRAGLIFEAISEGRVLALHPNFDPGREGVIEAIEASGVTSAEHLERSTFLSLLKRLAMRGGVLVGNSSAGLIEAAALRLPVVNVGERQVGREGGDNVVTVTGETSGEIASAVEQARGMRRDAITHPFGDGRTGERVALALETIAALDADGRRQLIRKRHAGCASAVSVVAGIHGI